MQTEEKQMKMSYLIKRFVPYFKKYKWILILDLICASLTTVCELVFPMLVRYITNMGINNIAGLTVGIILKIGLFYLILRIIHFTKLSVKQVEAILKQQKGKRSLKNRNRYAS